MPVHTDNQLACLLYEAEDVHQFILSNWNSLNSTVEVYYVRYTVYLRI